MKPTDRLAACMRYVLANSRLADGEKERLTNEINVELLELERGINALQSIQTPSKVVLVAKVSA